MVFDDIVQMRHSFPGKAADRLRRSLRLRAHELIALATLQGAALLHQLAARHVTPAQLIDTSWFRAQQVFSTDSGGILAGTPSIEAVGENIEIELERCFKVVETADDMHSCIIIELLDRTTVLHVCRKSCS